MAKKSHKRYSKKGGFFNESISNLENKFTELGSKISEGTSSLWKKSKEAIGLEQPSPSYVPSISSTPSYGGRRTRRRTRRSRSMKRGGSTNTLTSRVNQPIDSAVSRVNQPIQTLTSKVGGRRTRSRRSSRRRRH
jgi:hypothetical protein